MATVQPADLDMRRGGAIVEIAHAKLNLALHVRARRDDGYHEIETLFAFVADGDLLALFDGPLALDITGPFAAALGGSDNLILDAARLFADAFDLVAGTFHLDKRLPVASGVGGGSADAAAALRALARRHGIDPADRRLLACSERLGSDVPACLASVTAFGSGRGERRAARPGVPGTPVLLVNPGVAVSTAAVFLGWDGVDRGPLAVGDLLAVARDGRNDLQPSARAIAPVIDIVLERLAATDPLLARMSGSGATCFALYRDADACAAAAQTIRSVDPTYWCLESHLI